MTQTQNYGLVMVCAAGILSGSCAWPIKFIRCFRYEHWAFVSNLFALVLLPWCILLTCCPHAPSALSHLPSLLLIKANLFTMAWGIANVLVGLCLVRIGFSLTIGLMMGIGLPIGVILPILLHGTGVFANVPSLFSSAGTVILIGVAGLLAAICFMTTAGFGRDRILQQQNMPHAGFVVGLLMIVFAGLLQVGLSFAFVYTQADIVKALQQEGAGNFVAIVGVWAIALPGGALVNILYPAWLLTCRRSWGEFTCNVTEIGLSLLMGAMFFSSVVLNGLGMRSLGPLGASVGFAVYQAFMMAASQGIAFVHGEWHGITGSPRRQIYTALVITFLAVCIMAYGNSLAH